MPRHFAIPTLLVVAGLALACSEPTAQVGRISPEALLASPPPDALILDVRTPDEFASGHVPDAVNVPYDEVEARLGELPIAATDNQVVQRRKAELEVKLGEIEDALKIFARKTVLVRE